MSVIYLLVKIAAGLAVAAYLAIGLLLYVNQARFLFPGAYMPFPPELDGFASAAGLETRKIRASDGAELFLLLHAPQSGKPIVITFHGNGSYPESYSFLYAGWIASGYGVIAPAARGYPRSSGAADGEMMQQDALAVHDWAVKAYPGHPVIVFGQSLGTSPAIRVAAHRKVAGAVLVSPFKSMLSLVQEKIPYLPISLLLKSPFRTDLDIGAVTVPIIIFHGDRDTLVPIASGKALVAIAKTDVSFEVIAGAGHNDGLFSPDMVEKIAGFIEATSSTSR
ncbi:alpha/beta fold hydrolase [Rhizobium sp. TH2]|uniref:alpha/beta hydrolase n=1 Tax=Rhizobium sp. TH2 TaxID=2775403 RepID=UPI0021575CD5|nr:lysophospholipase [Rhizobium sp. TH2]UVC10894.1 alpha/beta fold hydrolase [Rhizobium sp. TH2]